VPPDPNPPAERQSNLTDPDSSLMRRSKQHEYRQAYYAQAVVCADGTQFVLATNLVAMTADAPSFADTILTMQKTIGLPKVVLADTGYASGPAIAALEARNIEPLVAIGRTQPYRPYDFRPPPQAKPPRAITEPWRITMKAKLETEEGGKRMGPDHARLTTVGGSPACRPPLDHKPCPSLNPLWPVGANPRG
jgi:Transposase DDE domain